MTFIPFYHDPDPASPPPPVPCTAVEVLGIALVCHRHLDNPKMWAVSDPVTGRSITMGLWPMPTRKAAIERAATLLEIAGGKAGYDAAVARHGR